MPALMDAALALHAQAVNVIPVRSDKRPIGRWKHWQTQQQSEGDVCGLFEFPQVAGLAIVCGNDWNGVAVRDYDDRAAYDQWRAKNKTLARTLPTAETRRGCHVYFKCVGAQSSPVEDGEIRGRGNYVVAPPSIHASGVPYQWKVPFVPSNLIELDPSIFGGAVMLSPECRHPVAAKDERGVTERTRERETDETEETEKPKTLPLSLCLSVTVSQAIRETVPAVVSQRNRLIFDLARRLKSIPETANARPAALMPVVREWHRLALPNIGTKPFDDTWSDFLNGWANVRIPRGTGVVEDAFARAQAASLSAVDYGRFDTDAGRLLFKLCRELQRVNGDDPFYLSCPMAERLIGLQRMQALRYLNRLVLEGTLDLIEKGTASKATRYRFTEPLDPSQEKT